MWKDIMPILIQIVLIPLLTALTGVAVKWINSKANEIKAKTDNLFLQRTISLLNDTISSTVVAINQTYVDELKQDGSFTKEAQEKAFQKVYDTAIKSLTEDSKQYLESYIGDLKEYIFAKIEEEVVNNKNTAIKKEGV